MYNTIKDYIYEKTTNSSFGCLGTVCLILRWRILCLPYRKKRLIRVIGMCSMLLLDVIVVYPCYRSCNA